MLHKVYIVSKQYIFPVKDITDESMYSLERFFRDFSRILFTSSLIRFQKFWKEEKNGDKDTEAWGTINCSQKGRRNRMEAEVAN